MSLVNRLKKNAKHIGKWARKNNVEAYRLYDRDIPEYPYIIDIYKEEVVIWLRLQEIDYSDKREGHLDELEDALLELNFPKGKRFLKKREVQNKDKKYRKQENRKILRTIQEGDFQFEVNLSDYLDTGLFLDHRPLRKIISEKNLKGKKALNLFSYTCSISVAMAKAGAKVTSVDLSPNYLDWGERNFELNGLSPEKHIFIESDCLEYIKEAKADTFDLIVIDPPTFSTSKKFKGTWDVQRDHLFVLHKCMDALAPGGELYFSTNLRGFKLDESLVPHYKEISFQTIPQDFHDKKIHKSFLFTKKP